MNWVHHISTRSIQIVRFSALCLLLTMASAGCGVMQDPIVKVRNLIEAGELKEAITVAKAIPKSSPAWAEAQFLLGRIAAAQQDSKAALGYYESVPRDGSPISLRCLRSAAEIQFRGCQLSAAIEKVEYVLTQLPDDLGLHEGIGGMLASSGQRSKAEPHLFEVIKKKSIQLKDLVWLTAPERSPAVDQYLEDCRRTNSSDHQVQLGLAIAALSKGNDPSARQRVAELLKIDPASADAQTLIGELSLDGDLQELVSWNTGLPASLQDHPGICYVRGMWARRIGQPRVAIRCLWETIRQVPNHQRAMYQLGQLMMPLDPIAAAAFTERAQKLKQYSDIIESVMIQRGRDRQQFQQMVDLLLEMGRDWEARAWALVACDLAGRMGWAGELLKSLSYVPNENPPRTRPERDLAKRFDLSGYPGFDTLPSELLRGDSPAENPHGGVSIRFGDQAAALGVDLAYFSSHDWNSKAVRIFESTGGGVGVIDFDLDGWSDLFLTQGVEWPLGSERPAPSGKYRDQIYRNRGHQFDNVTNPCCPFAEDGYGQGCSVGDFDNDGFPDIYVANIGANQLLHNNGDGTFSDVTSVSSIQGQAWTTSCLIADLNGDGNPDLYDVNYLQGERLFSIECSANRCSVRDYEGAPDQVQLSRGDGTFETVPDATPKQNSKGLGIVLVPIAGERLPRLFIANDQVPNFFLRPTSSGRYVDEGFLSGLAVNMYGQPTACMGVAAADVNRDGKLDLFVTNFEGEANNLYLQRDHGFFEDSILGSGLMAAGIPYVGWGTQFLDADNDGELDLIVANGHVSDFHEPNVQYRSPLQFFRGTGPGRFVQLPAAELGPLFERQLFGRSVATVDWNRDGRMDFVVSCIDSPTIIATGLCPEPQHWLNVRLHATSTERDAIGAVVELHQGSTVLSRQLVAGDGYQATNERAMHFGLGKDGRIDKLVVIWPSGAISSFDAVPIDATIDLIEGALSIFVQSSLTPND